MFSSTVQIKIYNDVFSYSAISDTLGNFTLALAIAIRDNIAVDDKDQKEEMIDLKDGWLIAIKKFLQAIFSKISAVFTIVTEAFVV